MGFLQLTPRSATFHEHPAGRPGSSCLIWPDEPGAQQAGTLVCGLGVAMESNVLFQDVVLIDGRELTDSLNLNLGEVLRTAWRSLLHQLRPEDTQLESDSGLEPWSCGLKENTHTLSLRLASLTYYH